MAISRGSWASNPEGLFGGGLGISEMYRIEQGEDLLCGNAGAESIVEED